MNRSRLATLAPLITLLGMLLALAGSASAAINYDTQKLHYGNFLPWEQQALGETAPQPFDLLGGNDFAVYFDGRGMSDYTYVKQNPWTFFNPLGLKTIEEYQNDIQDTIKQRDEYRNSDQFKDDSPRISII